jgi:hypothetical protein
MTRIAVPRVLPRRLPSPAMIVACIALTVALGGTSYAAIRLPAASVGTKHLKKGAVTGVKVKRNTLTGTQIAESTLAKVPSALNADSAGSADISRIDYRQSAAGAVPTSGHVRGTANCDAGTFATGGGAKVSNPNVAFILDSNPVGKTAWEATAGAISTGATLTVFVICADAAATTP